MKKIITLIAFLALAGSAFSGCTSTTSDEGFHRTEDAVIYCQGISVTPDIIHAGEEVNVTIFLDNQGSSMGNIELKAEIDRISLGTGDSYAPSQPGYTQVVRTVSIDGVSSDSFDFTFVIDEIGEHDITVAPFWRFRYPVTVIP